MMNSTDNAYGVDRELLREQLLAAVLNGRLALVRGEDEPVSAYLGELAVALADDTEVVRLDASQSHSASALVQSLARALDVAADDLLNELGRRGEDLPLALVIDNGECLGSRALTLLRNLLAKSGGGLGVLIGGEPELPDLLAQAGITPACEGAAEPAAAGEAVAAEAAADPAPVPGWRRLVPWKHLAAVTALALLVWMFWPAGEQSNGRSSSELALPAPEEREPAGQDEAGQGAGASTTTASGEESDEAVSPQPGPDKVPGDEPAESGARSGAAPQAGTSPEAPSGAPTGKRPESATGGAAEEPTGLDAELAYRSEDWLLTRTPERWMLQLALATNEQRARDLLDRLGRDRGGYYRARRDGEVVYIVLAGPFGSRGQALGARSSLPGYFRERGPFPRRIRAIANEIRALSGSGASDG